MKRLTQTRLEDPQLERVRQEHAEAIAELQRAPAVGLRVIADVSLADGTATFVPHGLGRPALWVGVSVPRNATTSGRVVESRTGAGDRAKGVVLTASGYGATIVVDLAVL